VAQEELNAADSEKIAGIGILTFISLITVLFYFFVKNALIVIRVFAKEVVDKVVELDKEKCKTEIAFHDFVPSSIVKRIKSKRGKEDHCQAFDCVTIFYGNMVGIEDLTNECSPSELFNFINLFYESLDEKIAKYQVYKVPTMQDEMVMVSGMPIQNGDQHVCEIALMALDLLAGFVVFQIPHKPNSRLAIRMGIDSGAAMGVVAGTTIPSYCVMSARTHVASQLERTGDAMRIHVSAPSKALLDKVGGFRCEPRGTINLGPKVGAMETYWLIGPSGDAPISPKSGSNTRVLAEHGPREGARRSSPTT